MSNEEFISKANENIETLIDELVGYMRAYVGSSCCPYAFGLFGDESSKRPESCDGCNCDDCKEDFYETIRTNLKNRYILK